MIPPALLRLVVAIVAATAAVAMAPAHADWRVAQSHWVDQTVYQPNCPKADCDCDCRFERLCLPACVHW